MNYKIEKIGKFRKYKPIYDPSMQISVGSSVKLIFKILESSAVNAERLWVTITEISGKTYKGVIDNDPQYVDIKDGEEVVFTKANIFDVYSEE